VWVNSALLFVFTLVMVVLATGAFSIYRRTT
jgi:hypothetical protein